MGMVTQAKEKSRFEELHVWAIEAGLALMLARKANLEALENKRRVDLATLATKQEADDRLERNLFLEINTATKAGLFEGSNADIRKQKREAWELENPVVLALKQAKADMEEAVRLDRELADESLREAAVNLQYAQDWWNVVRAQIDLAVGEVGARQIERFADSLRELKYL